MRSHAGGAAGNAPSLPQASQIPPPGGNTPRRTSSRLRQNGVSPEATPKRRRPPKDNQEYLAFARRMLRAYGRRVVTEDPSTLAELITLQAELDAVVTRCARSLHAQGWSWGEIGAELGISRIAAFKRWADPAAPSSPPPPAAAPPRRAPAGPGGRMSRAEKTAAAEDQARRRAVRGWAFRAPSGEDDAIRAFLAGGECPEQYRASWELARAQLRLAPLDLALPDCPAGTEGEEPTP
jgi:hypothetical protein